MECKAVCIAVCMVEMLVKEWAVKLYHHIQRLNAVAD